MYWSSAFIPTVKEVPAEAELISHQLLIRGGYIRKLAAGLYTFLPLAQRVLMKISAIVREEMSRGGAREVLMPILSPKELWDKTGRWALYGKELMRVEDRHERMFALGPTHEEVITDLVAHEVRSYRDLPVNLYQINTKFRDEIRPRFGIMRAREFIMKDGYSFDRDEAGAEATYQKMFDAYQRIFTRCGLAFRSVEADSGAIGGSFSHEFMVLADSGEEAIISCASCAYAANQQRAQGKTLESRLDSSKLGMPWKKVETPNVKTVEEVAGFLKVRHSDVVKTLLYRAGEQFVAALVRGNHELNEVKLARAMEVDAVVLINSETAANLAGCPSGFMGPMGLHQRIPHIVIVADEEVVKGESFIVGANEPGFHVQFVEAKRDLQIDQVADIRLVTDQDRCAQCGGNLVLSRGIEVGHTFKLGDKYSKAMEATFVDEAGQSRVMVMGCYGIGVSRVMAAAVEQGHDANGIIWPMAIAPYQVEVLPVNVEDDVVLRTAETLYRQLEEAGVEVLMDDRPGQAGMKFKDADLIGMPIRITVGQKTLKEGKVELKARNGSHDAKVVVADILKEVKSLVQKLESKS